MKILPQVREYPRRDIGEVVFDVGFSRHMHQLRPAGAGLWRGAGVMCADHPSGNANNDSSKVFHVFINLIGFTTTFKVLIWI